MKKDVLVSISGTHIGVVAQMEDMPAGPRDEEEAIEIVTPASYYCRNGKHYVLFDEVIEGMSGTIKNRIKINGTDSLEIMKEQEKPELLPDSLRTAPDRCEYAEYGDQL